jgi:hypothetical protein
MGGGLYSQDVAMGARSTSRDAFAYAAYQSRRGGARAVHPELDPLGKTREVNNVTPIVVALDVTRSRGDDTKLMYEKLPMLMGQIHLHGYVEGPGISFAAVGDATCDRAPLQASQFEADNRLDDAVARTWIEEGGGGTGQESYELAAYFYARTKTVRLDAGIGKKGYFFFVGDEGFYPSLDRSQVRRVIGDDVADGIPSAAVFRMLQEKFHVFLLYPGQSLAERKADVDAEIRQRVLGAGGRMDNVAVRASLLWNDRNDLDLHVIAPSGEEIFYAHKRSMCGGWLDVDMNVRGETEKPVENVRWVRGHAPRGEYRVFVQNYRFHEPKSAPTAYRLELEVDGELRHYEGVVSPHDETGPKSNIEVARFVYEPHLVTAAPRDAYAAYADAVVLEQWRSVLPPEHILRVGDPKAIVDVLLGALAIADGARTLDVFLADLRARDATPARIEHVKNALASVGCLRESAQIEGEIPRVARRAVARTVRL